MKKIWFILVMVCSVCAFTACSDDDKGNEVEPTPECPVKNIALNKARTKVGDQLILTGEGFTAKTKLLLELDDTKIAVSDWTVAADGKQVTFTVPEAEAGTYNLVLDQDGRWTLDVTVTIVLKRLKGIAVNLFEPLNFTLNYKDKTLTSVSQTSEGREPWDYFVFTYANDSVYITADQYGSYPSSQGYLVQGGKQVKSCNGNAWTYNAGGYLEMAVIGTRILKNFSFTYEGGNLTEWSLEDRGVVTKYSFGYEGDRPAMTGVDVAVLYAAFLSGNNSNAYFGAQLLGLTGKASAKLPSVINGTYKGGHFDEDDNWIEDVADVSCNITDYTMDDDGYLTKVVLDDKLKTKKDLIITLTWE